MRESCKIEQELAEAKQRIAKLEATVSKQRQALETLQKEERHLLRRLEQHQQERQLIAYDIHDGLAQQIAGSLLHFQACGNPDADLPVQFERYATALRLLKQAAAETRFLVNELRSTATDHGDLLESIRSGILANGMDGPCIELVADASLSSDSEPDSLSIPVKAAIFRIVQEAVNNARRHSHADRICVTLTRRRNRLSITVEDEGVGFGASELPEDCAGIEGIHRRAELLGGHAAFTSSLGKGTKVTVELPISPREE